jgi:serine/threonine protein kinase
MFNHSCLLTYVSYSLFYGFFLNYTIFSSSVDMGTEEGWGCPEKQIGPAGLKHDMFSLCLIIYFCIIGSHPYGNIDNLYECETNMAKDDPMLISLYSEAKNLIERLLDSNPMKRYTINFFF